MAFNETPVACETASDASHSQQFSTPISGIWLQEVALLKLSRVILHPKMSK